MVASSSSSSNGHGHGHPSNAAYTSIRMPRNNEDDRDHVRRPSSLSSSSSSSSSCCSGVSTLGLLVLFLCVFALLDLTYVLYDHFNLGGFVQYLPWTENTLLVNDPLHASGANGGLASVVVSSHEPRLRSIGTPTTLTITLPSTNTANASDADDDTSTSSNSVDAASAAADVVAAAELGARSAAVDGRSTYGEEWGAAPYFDSLEEVSSCPPLLSILVENHVPVGNGGLAVVDTSSVDAYMRALHERLDGAHVPRAALNNKDWFGTIHDLPAKRQPSSTAFQRRTDYTIQVYENACIRVSKGLPEFLYVSPSRAERGSWLNDTRFYNPRTNEEGPLPPRWVGDQGRYAAVEKFEPDWVWVPAVPHPRNANAPAGIDTDDDSPVATFHQFTWDLNVGHQFHHQFWPMYQALHSHRTLHTPSIQSLMFNNGCDNEDELKDAATNNNFLGLDLTTWMPITRFFMRAALVDVQQRVRVLSQPSNTCRQPLVMCFERLAVSDTHDLYLNLHPRSGEMFDSLRLAMLRVLQFDPRPFPVHSSLPPLPPALTPAIESKEARENELAAHLPPARPLRVTIYSRRDSSRRRIINVDEIVAALSPHHIVRHVPDFGKQHPAEQLALYAHTDLLIAPHGAHMTFTFMQPVHSIVIECFAERDHFSWIEHLLVATGKRHMQLIGVVDEAEKKAAKEKDKKLRDMDMDFRVDLDALCKQLKEWAVPIEWKC